MGSSWEGEIDFTSRLGASGDWSSEYKERWLEWENHLMGVGTYCSGKFLDSIKVILMRTPSNGG